MALESASSCAVRIRNRKPRLVVLSYNTKIEVHQPFPRNSCRMNSVSVSGVTDRARKSGVEVESVLTEAGVRHDVGEVVTFGAE